jgi:hypothetical protein
MHEIAWRDLPGWCDHVLRLRGTLVSLFRTLDFLRSVTVVFSGVRTRRDGDRLVGGALTNPCNVEACFNVDNNDSFVVRSGDEGSNQ